MYTPSQIQDWYWEDKNLGKRQTVFCTSVDPVNKEHRDPKKHWPGSTASCMVQAENVEKTPRHGVLGRHKNLLKRKDLSSIKHDRTQSSFTTHSQHIVSRRLLWWKLEKSYTRKYMRHLALLRRFPFRTIGWKNWVQKLLEEVKTPNKPNQKIKNPIVSTVRPVRSCVPVSG